MHEHDHRTKTLINLSMYITHMNSYTLSFLQTTQNTSHTTWQYTINRACSMQASAKMKIKTRISTYHIYTYIIYIYMHIYTSKQNIYIYIHCASGSMPHIFSSCFCLPKILKNCCVTSGDEKLQNAKPREPRGSFYKNPNFQRSVGSLKVGF